MTQNLSNHGIGASEIAAIAGMNPYASPWDVWLRKTGQAADFEGNPFTEWGHRLEPAIRQAYADQTKATITVPAASLFHSERTWARATPDGIIVSDNTTASTYTLPPARTLWAHLIQCKNVGTWVERAWKDAPPAYVQLQEQWEMYVTGLPRADVAVLIGGNDFRIYTIHRDDKMIGDLVTIADDFWRRVETKTEPKVDASDACRDHFTKRLGKYQGVEMVADAELEDVITAWQRLHLEAKAIERETARLRNVVIRALAEGQADRVSSSVGAPYMQIRNGKPATNWKLVAELLGSTKCTADEYAALVAANTEIKPATSSLCAPRSWAKES